LNKEPICITGLMVRNEGKRLIAEIEYNGQWVEVINEWVGPMEFVISHIVEPIGMIKEAEKHRAADAVRL
jgi:hypothetical protein